MNQMIKIDEFPTLLAAHQADVRGPPVGRGPQVENRWCRDLEQVLQSAQLLCDITASMPLIRVCTSELPARKRI